jgi:hypothetical protein
VIDVSFLIWILRNSTYYKNFVDVYVVVVERFQHIGGIVAAGVAEKKIWILIAELLSSNSIELI